MALRHGRGPHSARLETWQHASYVLQSHDDLMMRIDGCGRQRQVRVDLFILYTELYSFHVYSIARTIGLPLTSIQTATPRLACLVRNSCTLTLASPDILMLG